MWLLYVTFEDFLHIKHPDTAARMKRYRQPSRDERQTATATSTSTSTSSTTTKSSSSISSKRRQDVSAGAVTQWLDNACHLHTSVAETTDWLRPEEEFEDWSDDTDRVRKLREAEVANAEAAAAAASQADESSLIDLEPFMCMNNSLHTRVKKIDKSTVRRMRSRSRTPERRNRNFHLATLPDNGRLPLEAPVIDCDLAASSEGLISPKQCSPVTTSSGYGSDHDCLRERDVDTILYGTLPSFPPMAGEGREAPRYVVMSGGKDSEAATALTGYHSDMLRHNGVLADKALDDIMARMKVSVEGQGHKRVFFKDNLGVKDVSRNENEGGDDSEEDQSGSVYQNLPAALYAQVSPPRPQAVYKSQGKLQSQPIWESTPLDEGHRPRIMQQSGGRDSASASANSAKDIRSLIRKRMGLLADDKTPVNSPLAYQSAFRPYTSSQGTPCLKPAGREHSIAEYRRSQDSQYLCMTTARKQTPSSLGSVLVNDVILQSSAATLGDGEQQDDDSQLQDDTLCAESHNSSGSSDSGRGTCSVDGEHHKMEDLAHDVDPIYETIPDTTGASLATTKSEHDYCRIGDVASLLELSSDAAVPSPPPQRYPPQPLVAQNAGQVPDVTSADGNSKLRILRPNERIQQSDIVDMDGFHTYTVGDVLESFGRFAGHLPPPKARGNLYSMFPEHRERRRVSRSLKEETSGEADGKAAVVGRTGSGKRTALGKKKLMQKVQRGAANSSLGGTLPTQLYPAEDKPVRPQPMKLKPQGKVPRPDAQPASAASEPNLYENLPAHLLPRPRAPGADFEFSTMVKETRPTRRPGAHYYGADAAGSVKKTLSFGDLSPGSIGSQESIEIFVDGTPSESGSPASQQPRAQHFQRACHQRHPAAVARHSTMAPAQQQPQHRHQRFRSDDLTDMTSHTGTSSGTADNSACDPVYQNIRELQQIREQKIKMAALARSSINRLPTPLRRTQSALHLQWNRNTVETQEIFC